MAITPWRHRGNVVTLQDFNGDRHRAETHLTAAAFGVTVGHPAIEEAGPAAAMVAMNDNDGFEAVDFTDDSDDDELWPLPGHNIVLGGLADDRIFGNDGSEGDQDGFVDDMIDAPATIRADAEFEIVDRPEPDAGEPTSFGDGPGADQFGVSDIVQGGSGDDESSDAARDYLAYGAADSNAAIESLRFTDITIDTSSII